MKGEEKWNNYVALFSFLYFVLSCNSFINKWIKTNLFFFSDGMIIKFCSLNFPKKKKPIYATEVTVCGLQCSHKLNANVIKLDVGCSQRKPQTVYMYIRQIAVSNSKYNWLRFKTKSTQCAQHFRIIFPFFQI